MACFWSIKALIEERPHVYLWTLTLAEVRPDWYIAACRRKLIRDMGNAVRDGLLPFFGGVRVTEIHPGGHGLHDHWPLSFGRALRQNTGPDKVLRRLAHEAGFGLVHRHPRPATVWSAIYLSGYLNKSEGSLLPGARRWACLGDWAGVKCREVEYESEGHTVFRNAYRDAVAAGNSSQVAFTLAQRAKQDWLCWSTDL